MNVTAKRHIGIIDGLSLQEAKELCKKLPTETTLAGTRIKFSVTKPALDVLVSLKATFSPDCRIAWGHLYKKETELALSFEMKSAPYPHQKDTFLRACSKDFFALEWEMGLGKSKTALDLVAFNASQGAINALLIVSLKDVHRNWVENELPKHFGIEHDAFFWNGDKVGNGVAGVFKSSKFVVVAINYDVVSRPSGTAFCKKFLTSKNAALILDESHCVKTYNSARTKALLKLAPLAKKRYTLSGTPVTQSPLDVWAPYCMLDPSVCGDDFFKFKNIYAVERELPGVTYEAWVRNPVTKRTEKVTKPVMTVTGYKNLDTLRDVLDPHRSRLQKEDVLDLPPKVYRIRPFTLSDEQKRAYHSLVTRMIYEYQDDAMSVKLALTLLVRLQQVACGFYVPDGSDPTEVMGEAIPGPQPRLEVLLEEVQGCTGKAIIWAPFRFNQRQIIDALTERYGAEAVLEYIGSTSSEDRATARVDFQNEAHPSRFLVASPQSAGTGLTLTAARDVFYFSNVTQLALRLQSEDRAHRIGQTSTVSYTDILAENTKDRKILESFQRKREIGAEISGDDLKKWLLDF